MASVRVLRVLFLSNILFAVASSASASTNTCDRDDAVHVATLRATRSYHPPGFDDDARTFTRPSWFFVPLAVDVLAGQAGPFLASLSWRDTHEGVGTCLFVGTGRQAHSPTCSGNGDTYRLGLCALAEPSGISIFGADGLIREATSARLHVFGGDSCSPTVATLDLTSPPDHDGDGIPDCVDGSVDRTKPSWPPGSTLTATTTGDAIELRWAPANDNIAVTGYRVFEDGNLAQEVAGSVLVTQVASVDPNVAHIFQVEAFDAAGNQSTDGPTASVLVDTEPPRWPTGATLTATPLGVSAATLTWPAATDTVGNLSYRIYADLALVGTTQQQTFALSSLDPSHLYTFTVQAVDSVGNESLDGPSATLQLDSQGPAWPPATVLGASISSGTATLVWTPATDNVGVITYLVMQDDQLVAEVSGGNLFATVSGLTPNVMYKFQIEAQDAAGNVSVGGPSAQAMEDTLAPTWPVGAKLTFTPTSLSSATFSWTQAADNASVAGYRVLVNGLPLAQTDGSTLSAEMVGLDPSIAYVAQVQAFDSADNVSSDGPQAQLRLDISPPSWPPGSTLAASLAESSAILVWTAAIDNVRVTAYRIYVDGQLVVAVGGATLSVSVPITADNATFQVQAVDAAGNASVDGPTTVVHTDRSPPSWPSGSHLTATASGPRSLDLSWSPANDDIGVTEYRIFQDGLAIRSVSGTTLSTNVVGLDPDATYAFRVDAVDARGNVAAGPATTAHIGTVDPSLVAPAIDPTVSNSLYVATAFLYTGPDAVQKGVASGTIEPRRTALLRGRALDRDGMPVADVRISVFGHTELGWTRTRSDGHFDLVVNGGGALHLRFEHADYLTVDRLIAPGWETSAAVADVVLSSPDPEVTEIEADVAFAQVARASEETDTDGTRRATLIVPGNTSASAIAPNGTATPLTSMHVRITELTVGDDGPAQMPAELPASSSYTYAAEFSVDEAVEAGATSVTFSQPVISYTENFLDIPVGEPVPVGTYDRQAATWRAMPNGRVIEILSVAQGIASLDINGDGLPDSGTSLATLGITDDERRSLAVLYQPGTTVWRVPLAHFSLVDLNWGPIPDGDGTAPTNPPRPADDLDDSPQCDSGSIIECENQVVGESIDIPGTGLTLNYSSLRAPGRSVERTLQIPLVGSQVPNGLVGVQVTIAIAGQEHHLAFPPTANQTTTFTWDGRDAYGRTVPNPMLASVRVAYEYRALLRSTPGFQQTSFNSNWAAVRRTSQGFEAAIDSGQWLGTRLAVPENSLGGWTISAHHDYDQRTGILYRGDGGHEEKRTVVSAVPSVGSGLGVSPSVIATAPEGATFYAESVGFTGKVFRVDPNGTTTLYAGGGIGSGRVIVCCASATSVGLQSITGMTYAADGSLYLIESRTLLHKVRPDGIIITVAGTGQLGSTGDEGPASQATLDSGSVAIGSDGSLYLTQGALNGQGWIRRLGTDSIIRRFQSSSSAGQIGSGTKIAIGPSDTIFGIDVLSNTVWRRDQAGRVTKLAGFIFNDLNIIDGDGGLASAARVRPTSIAVDASGTVYLGENGLTPARQPRVVVRAILPDGHITAVVGTGSCTSFLSQKYGVPAPQFGLCNASALSIGGDGSLYIAQGFQGQSIVAAYNQPPYRQGAFAVASRDGAFVFDMDGSGRHLDTKSTLFGTTLATFEYDSGGRLTAVDDGESNVSRITYGDSGATIASPFGLQTDLAFNAEGYLATITDPIGRKRDIHYSNGLIASFADPIVGLSSFSYDESGRLVRDTAVGGGFKELSRSDLSAGKRVTRTTRLGRSTTFDITGTPVGDQAETITGPSGLASSRLLQRNGTRVITQPDGVETTVVDAADTRFGSDSKTPRSVLVQLPSGRSLRFAFTSDVTLGTAGNPLSVTAVHATATMNDAKTARLAYSAADRSIATTTPGGRHMTATLDSRGRPLTIQLPNRFPLVFTYDGRGRLVESQQGSRTLDLEYNAAGYLSRVSLPDGRVTEATYDGLGRPVALQRPDGRLIQWAYELDGRRLLTIPPGRLAHVEEVNSEERTTAYRPPLLGTVVSDRVAAFDYDGALLAQTLGNGESITVDRDSAGRTIRLNTPRGTFSYDYDTTTGHRVGEHTPEGQSDTYSFDGPLLLTRVVDGQVRGSVSLDYDSDLRVASETVNGQSIAYGYNSDDLATQVGGAALTRDAMSSDVTAIAVGAVTTTVGRNGYGEVDELATTLHGMLLQSEDVLLRDNGGRILSRRELLENERHTYEYSYDAVGQLTDVAVDGETHRHYEYDENGNRIDREEDGQAESSGFDSQDRLVSSGTRLLAYTSDGALESNVETASGSTTTYRYDLAGNLLEAVLPDGSQVGYLVDATGRRVGRLLDGSLVSGWIYGASAGPAVELDASGSVVTRFVYAVNPWVPTYMVKGGTTYALVTDHLGSVRLVVDATTGAVAQRLDYDEFGRVLLDTSPGFQPFGFSGGLYDPATGLVRLGARDYDASTGRWTVKDPLLFAGGSSNLYEYAANDPVNLFDPTGLQDVPDFSLFGDSYLNADPEAMRGATFGMVWYGTAEILGLAGCPWCAAAMIIATAKNENDPALALGIMGGAAGGILSEALAPVEAAADGVAGGVPAVAEGGCGAAEGGAAEAGAAARVSAGNSYELPTGGPGAARKNPTGGGGPFNPDQETLVDLAKTAQRTGISVGDAETLLDWAREVGLKFRNDIGTNHWIGGDHIHVGPINHIPVVK